MNSKIALSGLSILASLALIGGATFAYFSDVGTSTGNVFGAGTFDLKLGDDNESVKDDIDTTWNNTNMAPGTNPITATLKLRNSGTVIGNNVHLKAENVITDTGYTESQPMSKLLEITAATYDGVDILSLIPDTNGNTIKDLNDLEVSGAGPQIGPLTLLNVDYPLILTIQLHSSADNTFLGDTVTTKFTATLHQSATE